MRVGMGDQEVPEGLRRDDHGGDSLLLPREQRRMGAQVVAGDAGYLLFNLFVSGPAPVAIECPPPAGKGLPATGQTECYGFVEGQGWTEVPCGEAVIPGQDGAYQAGCPIAGRFVDHGDGTVTDTCTWLIPRPPLGSISEMPDLLAVRATYRYLILMETLEALRG